MIIPTWQKAVYFTDERLVWSFIEIGYIFLK